MAELKGVWSLTPTIKSGVVTSQTASYKIGGKEMIKLTNLSPDLVRETDGTVDGLEVTEDSSGNKVTLSPSALNGATVAFTSTTYALAIDEDVPTVGFEAINKTVTNGTATFKGTITAGYTIATNGKSLTYSAVKENQVLATVTGLATTAEDDDVILDEEAGTITLGAAALKQGAAALTLKNGAAYKLAIGGDVDTITTTGTWTYASGKATLKGTVDTAGYAVSADGKKVNYIAATKAGTTATLATVSGLGADCGSDAAATEVDETGNFVITLPADSLNQSTVTVSGNGYVLALDGDVTTSENAETRDEWSVSGTTATYKQIMPVHYDLVAGKVTYTNKETDVKTYATVTNLATGLTTSADKQSLLKGSTKVVTIDDNVITVSAGALNKKPVALTGTFCTLKLDEDVDPPQVDTSATAAWAVSKTTATYKGTTTEGYSDTNDWTITYVAKKIGAVLATVDNLVSGLNAANLNNSESDYYIAVDNETGKITLPASVLDAKTITVTPGDGFKYTLTLAEDEALPTSPVDGHTWEVDGTTAKLYKGTSYYYDDSAGTTVKYVDAVKGSKVATLENLKSGIAVTDLPPSTDIKKVNPKDKLITIPLSGEVLDKKTVALTGSTGYMLALTDAEELAAKPDQTIWELEDDKKNTKATLSNYTTEGWKANSGGTQIVYSSSVKGATIATLEGFKSGLQLNDDKTAFKSGITVYTEDTTENEGTTDERDYTAKTIAIEKAAVGSNSITLKTNAGYKLAVGKDLTESEAERDWDEDNKGNAVYTYSTPAGYNISEDGKTFTATKKNTTKVTITGLGTNPTDITDLAPDDTDKVITLSKKFLGESDVKVTGGYTLKLDSAVKGPELGEPTWDLATKGKAYLKGTYTKAGYTQTNDTTITYTPNDDSTPKTLATVSGLTNPKDTSAAAVANDGSAGIEVTDGKIILSSKLLGTSKVTLGNNDPYTLALNEDDENLPLESKEVTGWVVSGTNANYQSYTRGFYAMETKKDGSLTGAIIYNKDGKATVLATVKGLAKGTTIDNKEDYDEDTKTLTLKADQLGATNVTLTGTGYSLALGDDVQKTLANVTEWVNSGTKATYQSYDKAYYTLSGSTVTYHKPGKATVHLTLNGVASEVTDANLNKSKSIITLNADQLNQKSNKATTKLTTSKEDDYVGYKIVLASTVENVPDPEDADWDVDGKGKATYIQPVPENTFVNDGTTVTYYNAETNLTLATLSGLNKNITDSDFYGVKVKDGVITLTGDVLQEDSDNASKKVTVSKGYELALANSVAAPEDTDPKWNFADLKSKGTATYNNAVSAGYTLDAKGAVNYSAEKTTNTLATLSGLNKDYDGDVTSSNAATLAGISVNDETGVITLSNADALTTKVSVKGTGYTVAVSNDLAPQTLTDYTDAIWSLKGTTATLSLGKSAGYVQDKNKTSVSISKPEIGDTIATLSGLGKNTKAENGQLGTIVNKNFTQGVFMRDGGAIALTPAVLGTTDVKLKNEEGHELTIANENFTEPQIGDLIWNYDASKGTATLYQTTTEGWTLEDDDTTLKYTANKDNAALTVISGLSKTFAGDIDDAITMDGDTLTIEDATLLGTSKVTIANKKVGDVTSTYKLELGDDIPDAAKTVTNWLTSATKATLKTYSTAYYKVESGAIVYHKPEDVKNSIQAEVSGIAKDKDVDINDCVNKNTHVITLGKDQLGTSAVTLTNKKVNGETSDYTLVLGSDAPKATPDSKATWVNKGTTANLTASVSAGFSQASDVKINYTKVQPAAVIAVIKGVVSGAMNDDTLSTSTTTINPATANLSSVVTIDGKETYGFKFANDYNGKITGAATADTINAGGKVNILSGKGDDVITVSGSAASVTAAEGNDTINITGSGASINAGKGDDSIKSSGNGNTFFYASGDGNDIIVGFGATDSIKTGVAAKDISVKKSGSDALVTLGTGSITVKSKGSALNSITILDSKDNQIYPAASSDVLLADDNYSQDAAAISDIKDAFSASYTPYDFESGLDLVKKDSFTPVISYNGDK